MTSLKHDPEVTAYLAQNIKRPWAADWGEDVERCAVVEYISGIMGSPAVRNWKGLLKHKMERISEPGHINDLLRHGKVQEAIRAFNGATAREAQVKAEFYARMAVKATENLSRAVKEMGLVVEHAQLPEPEHWDYWSETLSL